MRRSSSSSTEVETEDTVKEGAVAPSLEEGESVVAGQSPVCGLEAPDAVDVVEEAAKVLLFLEVEGFDGSTVAVSAIVCESSSRVILTHFCPLLSALVLDTTLTGRVAHGVLRRTEGGSSFIINAIV